VIEVEKGWQNFMEINRVTYDPELVGLQQLEDWLTQAETFRKRLEPVAQGDIR